MNPSRLTPIAREALGWLILASFFYLGAVILFAAQH